MAEPLTWKMPGLTWDSGKTWDGVAATKRKSMNNVKVNIDFSGYVAAELGPLAQNIHVKMTANAATFTNPPITMVDFATLVADYDAKLVARASRATADTVAFNEVREELEQALGVLGNFVNSVGKGDPVIVEQSGFPSYDTSHAPLPATPAAPTDLRLRHGDQSGGIVARYKADRQPSTNEVQTCTSDPNIEANWATKGFFQGGRAELNGFTPGTVVWVRVRTIGAKNAMGAWSDPAQIRVL